MGFPSTIVHRERLPYPFTLQDFNGTYSTPTGETIPWPELSTYLLSAGAPSSADVKTAQHALGLEETGVWDSDTAAGIVDIQLTYGLPTTGLPDAATLAKIAAVLASGGDVPKKKKKDNTGEVVTVVLLLLAVKFFILGD
jgi:hypothetical protein